MDLTLQSNNTTGVSLTPFLNDILNGESRYNVPFALGRDDNGDDLIYGLEKCPHLLVAGTTGSGKSFFLHNVIMSAMVSDCGLVLMDVKRVEFSIYENNKRLALPIAYHVYTVRENLRILLQEMSRRFEIFKNNNCRNLEEYAKTHDDLKPIVVVIDELADIVLQSKDAENKLIRLAQLSRAAGIHLVVATQRPDSKILNGLIRANFPSRICFRVQSASNSKIILDRTGGEILAGNGDGLALFSGFNEVIHFQAPILDNETHTNLLESAKLK